MIRQLRDILRRDFGAHDAWVVRTDAHCRLDVRVGGRQITLVEDAEEAFWAQFYTPVEREWMHLGERVVETQLWRRANAELAAILRRHWTARLGPTPGG